jgi:hypothetical protein
MTPASYTKTCNTCGKQVHKTQQCKKGMCISCHKEHPCTCGLKLAPRGPKRD